jgi:tubulin alpha
LMREVISVSLGKAGIKVGSDLWELYCLEHGILPDGQIPSDGVFGRDGGLEGLFSETEEGRHFSRSVFIDLEPSAVDQVRTGVYKELFQPWQLISGKEDASNLFARGYNSIGREMLDICLDRIRKLVENCSDFQGFLFHNSVGGGTGSGFGSLLLERLSVEYGKKSKMIFPIYPSPAVPSNSVEPYNSVLSTHSLIEHTDLAVVLDNQAVYNLLKHKLLIDRPSYSNLNRLIAHAIATITSSLHLKSQLNVDLAEFQTNLVPYPRIHFVLTSSSPFIPSIKATPNQLSVSAMTFEAFNHSSIFASCDPQHGKYMACCLMFFGNISSSSIGAAICTLKTKRTIQFVDWCPSGFKCGCYLSPRTVVPGEDLAKVKQAVACICNNTAVSEVFSRLNAQFDSMHSKRAFLHWYLREGMEEGEFVEAREDLAALEADYLEVATETAKVEGEEEY